MHGNKINPNHHLQASCFPQSLSNNSTINFRKNTSLHINMYKKKIDIKSIDIQLGHAHAHNSPKASEAQLTVKG